MLVPPAPYIVFSGVNLTSNDKIKLDDSTTNCTDPGNAALTTGADVSKMAVALAHTAGGDGWW